MLLNMIENVWEALYERMLVVSMWILDRRAEWHMCRAF